MNTEELKQIALAAAKNIKTQQDLTEFQRMLTKVTVEAALNAELDDHLGYERHETSDGSNYRNGYSSKTVQTDGVNLSSKRLAIVTEILTPSWSRRTSDDLPRWMTRSCFFMRKA